MQIFAYVKFKEEYFMFKALSKNTVKNNNIVKNYYNLKELFSIWIYFIYPLAK